jgi:hypothetical protein
MSLERVPVEDRHLAALIGDDVDIPQLAGRICDAGALHAQHHAEKFLRQKEFVGLNAIVRHQKPSAATLLDRVKRVASGGQRDLVEEGMRVAQHDSPERGALRHLVLKDRGGQSKAGAGNLDVGAIGRGPVAKRDRQPQHPLVPDRAHFGGLPVRHLGHEGNDPNNRKIDPVDRLIALV